MLRIIALLFVLLASPAYAVNDFKGQTFFDVAQTALDARNEEINQ